MRHLDLATRANGGDEAVEATIRRTIDDPPAVAVLRDTPDLGVELGLLVEPVALPELANLLDDLLPVGIATLPLHGRVEAIHEGMNLQTRRLIHPTPNTAYLLLPTLLKYDNIKAVPDAVRRSCHAGDSRAYDGDLRSVSGAGRGGRVG